jgi:hypothetical protein
MKKIATFVMLPLLVLFVLSSCITAPYEIERTDREVKADRVTGSALYISIFGIFEITNPDKLYDECVEKALQKVGPDYKALHDVRTWTTLHWAVFPVTLWTMHVSGIPGN